jgi:hypothetical protein
MLTWLLDSFYKCINSEAVEATAAPVAPSTASIVQSWLTNGTNKHNPRAELIELRKQQIVAAVHQFDAAARVSIKSFTAIFSTLFKGTSTINIPGKYFGMKFETAEKSLRDDFVYASEVRSQLARAIYATEYKIHLMLKSEYYLESLQILFNYLRFNPEALDLLYSMKILSDESITDETDELVPHVVIYPSLGKDAATKLLAHLCRALANVPTEMRYTGAAPRISTIVYPGIFYTQNGSDFKRHLPQNKFKDEYIKNGVLLKDLAGENHALDINEILQQANKLDQGTESYLSTYAFQQEPHRHLLLNTLQKCMDFCEALNSYHARNIIVRYFERNHIIMSDAGKYMIMDHGRSRQLKRSDDIYLDPKIVNYRPKNMAPEVEGYWRHWEDEFKFPDVVANCSKKSDIYSLGVILKEELRAVFCYLLAMQCDDQYLTYAMQKLTAITDSMTEYQVQARPTILKCIAEFTAVYRQVDQAPTYISSDKEKAFCVAFLGSEPQVLALIKSGDLNLDDRNSQGHTLLHIAALRGFSTLTTELLAMGIDMAVKSTLGNTALDLAIAADYHALAELLGSPISTTSQRMVITP